jgi:hypothetical protein
MGAILAATKSLPKIVAEENGDCYARTPIRNTLIYL